MVAKREDVILMVARQENVILMVAKQPEDLLSRTCLVSHRSDIFRDARE